MIDWLIDWLIDCLVDRESLRLYEKFASDTSFLRLAKWLNDSSQKFCEWNKG